MADLTFTDSHNMVAYLEKSEDNVDFAEIVDFLNVSPISSKSTAWNEFGTNMASAVICLAKKQKFIFSKLVFDAIFNDEYDTPSHTKKVLANVRRKGKDFSGTVTTLFATMLIQSQAVEGEGSRQPTEPQHIPTTASPSHSSKPTNLDADKAVHEERGDSVERAATTATSLDTEQGSGNINRTQSMAIPNAPFPQGIGSGGSPRRQDTMGDRHAQTRMKLQELMDLCTKLSERVLDLENVKDAQALEIKKLKKRGRYSLDTGVNTVSTSITTASINITTTEPITTASAPITTVGVYVSTAEPSTPPTTTTFIEDEDLTITQTLMKMRSVKSKEKSKEKGVSSKTATILARGVIVKEASETATGPTVPPLQIDPKDKGKCIMQEPKKLVKVKGKDQIKYDADVAKRLQAELDEKARLEREREEEASKAANIAEWEDVQAIMDADYELATNLQAEEQGEISIEERSKLFVELMNERKKHFARFRA
ncbi:hypothetical protein Tco_0198759 [Tanacetum coccineum]